MGTFNGGIIGQLYEERKSGKLGTLLDKDEKYKTLLMEEPDTGKTFNISFSSLKSNWRKKEMETLSIHTNSENSEDVIETETEAEVAETASDVESETEEVNTISFAEKKKEKLASDESETLAEISTQLLLWVADICSEYETELVSVKVLLSKFGAAVKVKNRRKFEIYALKRSPGMCRFYTYDEYYDKVNWTVEQKDLQRNVPGWIMKTCFDFSIENIDEVLDNFRDFLALLVSEADDIKVAEVEIKQETEEEN